MLLTSCNFVYCHIGLLSKKNWKSTVYLSICINLKSCHFWSFCISYAGKNIEIVFLIHAACIFSSSTLLNILPTWACNFLGKAARVVRLVDGSFPLYFLFFILIFTCLNTSFSMFTLIDTNLLVTIFLIILDIYYHCILTSMILNKPFNCEDFFSYLLQKFVIGFIKHSIFSSIFFC